MIKILISLIPALDKCVYCLLLRYKKARNSCNLMLYLSTHHGRGKKGKPKRILEVSRIVEIISFGVPRSYSMILVAAHELLYLEIPILRSLGEQRGHVTVSINTMVYGNRRLACARREPIVDRLQLKQ